MEKVCNACGSKLFNIVDQRGGMQIFCCDKCGELCHSLGSFDIPISFHESELQVNLFLCWYRGVPTNKEIVMARSIIPKLKELSLDCILKRSKGKSRLDLGLFWRGEALDLIKKAKTYGLHITDA